MRVSRDLRSLLRIRKRRAYHRRPLQAARPRPRGPGRYFTVGGIVVGPRGARNWALNLVRREIADGTYLSSWRLESALDRMIARMF
jgi:hypothetical protein